MARKISIYEIVLYIQIRIIQLFRIMRTIQIIKIFAIKEIKGLYLSLAAG